MNEKYKTLLKNIITFTFGSLGSKIILFFLLPLYTGYLTKEQYGVVEIFNTISQLVIPLFSVVIFDATLKFGISKKERKEDVLLASVIVLIIGAVVSFISLPILNNYEPLKSFKLFFVAYIISYMFNGVFINYLKVKEKNLLFSCVNIVQTLLMAFLNIYFLIYTDLKIEGYLLANIICLIFSACVAFIFGGGFIDLKKSKFDKQLLVRMVKYSSPLILNNISWLLIHSSDKIMIQYLSGIEDVGLYAVASKFPSLINIIISIFTSAWSISSFKESENNNARKFYSTVFNLYWFMLYLACICLFLIIYFITSFILGDDFKESWIYIPFLLLSAVFFALSQFYATLFSTCLKNYYNMFSIVFAAIINIILNYFLIIKFKIWGAVISTCISSIILFVIRGLTIKKFIKIECNLLLFLLSTSIVFLSCYACVIQNYFIMVSCLIVFTIINFRFVKTIIKNEVIKI